MKNSENTDEKKPCLVNESEHQKSVEKTQKRVTFNIPDPASLPEKMQNMEEIQDIEKTQNLEEIKNETDPIKIFLKERINRNKEMVKVHENDLQKLDNLEKYINNNMKNSKQFFEYLKVSFTY